ncbi:DUF1653 domain-containing protein [Fulvimonas soli]|jgi:hypothetical protein|uniref:Uncharacterized protein DUF1653 n=1 Tax=Fulvimonas soli TaxID=155197 RepID=A0A316IGW5_9GAMM|nr:DUF1653 domain-containing protein [Fulvimonas soli]PWK92040.1 uncharacterized protein DUF1653 [Fulvimonas soli]TNY25214.1 hypothetical protein BV497_15000 [Fulvimonas soli]
MTTVAGIYRHYKGQRYRVLGTARHSETLEELVVYQALYGEHGLWVRPAAMFAETVEMDGEPIPRFALEQAESPDGPRTWPSALTEPTS